MAQEDRWASGEWQLAWARTWVLGVAGPGGHPLWVGRCPWASVGLERSGIYVREFARCVRVGQHPRQVCACLQPGVCLQVCLLLPCPPGHGSRPLACLRVLVWELRIVRMEDSLSLQVSFASAVGVAVG